ncbi:two component regulator with propeller domain [Lutibacter sp. Hel_I_33_5]|uniref:sensor histidine kinase n=1 Tax=Lutibacter sp. Hel_I_33_5 TaxID=1566289 RepID=UPI00119D2624|nr:histidine kinase [Lutibacter sp. Hel_I_33_5]TVZ56842.1 two component regulator with propeller domain [Lutibacter sp. Hel_I_33_5]
MLKKLTKLLFFSLCIFLYAQEPIRYTTKQSLPSNHIYDMQEDADGFMWFATNRGLVKYDGETFKTLTIKDGLPNNDTWALDLDFQGRLWYFSKSSYQGYIKNDSIYKFQEESKKVRTPSLFSKNKEMFWYYSRTGVITLKDDKLVNLLPFKDVTYSLHATKIIKQLNLGNQHYTYIFIPTTKEFFFFIKDKLLVYDFDFNFKEEIPNTTKVDFTDVNTVAQGILPNNQFYKTNGSIIFFFNVVTKKFSSFDLKSIDRSLKTLNFLKIKAVKDEIQVSFPGHLLIFNYNLELISKHSFIHEASNIASYKDSKGNIWLRDFTSGISLIPNTQVHSRYYFNNKKVQKIAAIDSLLISGIQQDGFYTLNPKTTSIKKVVKLKNSQAEIYQIKKDATSQFITLVSSYESYFYKSSLQFQKQHKIKLHYQDYYNDQYGFKDIRRFNNFDYYTSAHSISKINPTTKKGPIVSDKLGLIISEVFKNSLFFGGSDGLHQLVNDSLSRPKLKHRLLKVSVSSIAATKNNLWVGTDGRGMYSYNEKNLAHLKVTDGLSIQRILHKDSLIWIASNIGVHKITLDQNSLENSKITNNFFESDGLLQNNTNDIAMIDSILYAASDIGLAKINVNSEIYKTKPKLYFKTKKDTMSFAKEARDNISISFGLQDFVNQENTSFEYRLLPNQKKWVTTQTRILNFSNLKPNLYVLEVKATDQHTNFTIKKQYIEVMPLWWQTLVAKVSFCLLGLFIIFGFFQIIKKRIERKEKAKTLLNKRISGLELQSLRSQMNPHFVHNSLNAIQYYIQRNEVELSEDYLSKFSKLVRLFFEYSRRNTITIAEEIGLLENYLLIEKLRFEDKLSFKIEVDKKLDVDDQNIPSMILQPIIENAVNHGLFHKKENGFVRVNFQQKAKNSFTVIIEDDGIGIKKAKEIYKNSTKNYQSNSTNVLEERLSLLKQSHDWDIEYTIKDLSNFKEKTGTKVILKFNKLGD